MMKNRFGMFVHWGVYSMYAYHEQVLARAGIPNEEYEARAKEFNPTEYDPEEWVLLAKEAGMEYICFTTKHHDGFCMWDTKATDYSIMNNAYGRDVLKELADACRKHGMKLSLYYSNPDWHNEYAYNNLSSHQWKCKYPERSDPEKYRAFICEQLRELLTNYGEIYTFFWDIEPRYYAPEMNELIRELQPNILINDRGYDAGDFATPERKLPDGSRFGRMTEACQSVGEQSWGYRENEDYFSARFLMTSVDKIMAMGGSYLLNVGPMANGKIPEEAKHLIRTVGNWYNRVKDALVDTEASPYIRLHIPDPSITVEKNGKTYFHFYKGLSSTSINFDDLDVRMGRKCIKIQRAVLLNNGTELPIRYTPLPSYCDLDAVARVPHTSICKIPVDEFAVEPIVIEVEWERRS